MCIVIESRDRGNWVLGSGCPFKSYFTKYHDFDKGRVVMGNNAMCRP